MREPQLFAGDHVHRDDVQRDRQVVELVDLHVLGDQPPKSRFRHQMVAGSKEPEQAAERVGREDLAAPQIAPDRRELVRRRDGLRARRHERAVERTGRGADDDVRADAVLVEDAQHAHLDGAEPGTAGEDERHVGLLLLRHARQRRRRGPGLPSA